VQKKAENSCFTSKIFYTYTIYCKYWKIKSDHSFIKNSQNRERIWFIHQDHRWHETFECETL